MVCTITRRRARVIRSWKFLLLYLHHDGQSSRKYALEALYIMFEIYALLSAKAAHHLIWNRFSKRRQKLGGNISLDLALEFLNRLFKDAVKKLGPNASKKSINRICHAMGVTKQLTENFRRGSRLWRTWLEPRSDFFHLKIFRVDLFS